MTPAPIDPSFPRRVVPPASTAFDNVVVGAGSAGCVLADRLTEDGTATVLPVETGGGDWSPFIRMPSALALAMETKSTNWNDLTEPEPHLGGRRITCPRGKVVGARPRSTAWSTSAPTRWTSSPGTVPAREAGPMPTCCPISSAPKGGRRAATATAGATAHSTRATARWTTPCSRPSSRPAAISYDGKDLADRHGFQAHIGSMRAKSRGRIALRSADPHARPSILCNDTSHPDDWREMRAAVRLTREIFAQPPFDRYRGEEIQPGAAVQSDGEIDAFIRDRIESGYPPCSTCRMGALADPMAVVGPDTRVIGVGACGSSMRRSCRRSPPATSTRRPSCWPRGRPTTSVTASLWRPSNLPFYRAEGWEKAQR